MEGPEGEYIVRVWKGLVIVLHQNCEIEFAHPHDSRAVVAPVVAESQWPKGPWDQIRKGRLPGYFYLPQPTAEEAEELTGSFQEGTAVFASRTLSHIDALSQTRVATLRHDRLIELQDAYARAVTVRGLASTRELDNLKGRTILDIRETAITDPGPSRLVKVFLNGTAAGEEEEATVTWGVRKAN